MITGPEALWRKFEARLAARNVPEEERAEYRKWLRYYLDFRHKYKHPYASAESLPPFLAKLASKRQTESQCRQAEAAVRLYHGMLGEHADGGEAGGSRQAPIREIREESPSWEGSTAAPPHRPPAAPGDGASWVEPFSALTNAIKLRHYSSSTLKTYTTWARKFQSFTRSKEPASLSTEDVKAFLTDLAVRGGVAASTQNQAFNALLFFFRHALGREFGKVDGVVRAKRKRTIPVVLSREEIDRILEFLEPPFDLVVKLLFGCGLRISECLDLRVG